jgi:hypothetical protein
MGRRTWVLLAAVLGLAALLGTTSTGAAAAASPVAPAPQAADTADYVGNYHIDKNLTASLMYWRQKYDNTDWQTNNPGANGEPFTPYMGRTDPGSNRWFWLGARVPSYDANVLRASFTYSFLGTTA